MNGDSRCGVDQAVTVGPGQQFDQLPAALERRVITQLLLVECAAVQAPMRLAVVTFRPQCQCQQGLAQIWRNTGIDHLDLACLALEGSVQPPAEQRQIAAVDLVDDILAAPELRQKAVAVGQFTDQ